MRRKGVTMVEALIAVALLGVAIAAVISLFSGILNRTDSQKMSATAAQIFDSVRLAVSTDELCSKALKGPPGNQSSAQALMHLTNDAATGTPVIVGDNIKAVYIGSHRIAKENDLSDDGKFLVHAIRIVPMGPLSHSEGGSPPRLRTPAYIQVQLASVSNPNVTYERNIPTQIISEPSGDPLANQKIVSCYVQKFHFDTLIGRSVDGVRSVSNTTTAAGLADGFDSTADDGTPADNVLNYLPARANFARLGCNENLGWKLVNCNRYDSSTSPRAIANIVKVISDPVIMCETDIRDADGAISPGITLEATCMRVSP